MTTEDKNKTVKNGVNRKEKKYSLIGMLNSPFQFIFFINGVLIAVGLIPFGYTCYWQYV
jgi:hypothetical protein